MLNHIFGQEERRAVGYPRSGCGVHQQELSTQKSELTNMERGIGVDSQDVFPQHPKDRNSNNKGKRKRKRKRK